MSRNKAVRDQRTPWFTVTTFRTMYVRGWMVDRATKCVAHGGRALDNVGEDGLARPYHLWYQKRVNFWLRSG